VTILYVCAHNAGRSQMAEALTNQLATRRGLAVRAESAGTAAGERVNPVAEQVMREIGVPLDGYQPKQLTQEMVTRADRVVTMGCGVDAKACPARFLVTEDWGLDDPAGQSVDNVRGIRDQIRARIDAMLDEIAGAP
jgi:arsenate reductase (thioredoxin)